MSLSGRMLAQLARVAQADAAAALDPRWTPDDGAGPAPFRVITWRDVRESRRLSQLAARCQVRAALAGFSACDDPFESDEENERRRVETWERILP